jgi:hypothetical protein
MTSGIYGLIWDLGFGIWDLGFGCDVGDIPTTDVLVEYSGIIKHNTYGCDI